MNISDSVQSGSGAAPAIRLAPSVVYLFQDPLFDVAAN